MSTTGEDPAGGRSAHPPRRCYPVPAGWLTAFGGPRLWNNPDGRLSAGISQAADDDRAQERNRRRECCVIEWMNRHLAHPRRDVAHGVAGWRPGCRAAIRDRAQNAYIGCTLSAGRAGIKRDGSRL
jgi:hypothetical protein